MESDVVTLQDIFLARPPDDESHSGGRSARLLSPLTPTGLKPHFIDKMAASGVVMPPNFFSRVDEGGQPVYVGANFGGHQ